MRDLALLDHTDTVNSLLARYGVKFGICKNNVFKEQLFPFDAIPRIIEHTPSSINGEGRIYSRAEPCFFVNRDPSRMGLLRRALI